MKWTFFIDQCRNTILPQCESYRYLYGGLKSEIGEVFGKIKKYDRQDFDFYALRDSVKYEIGDVMWYIAMIGDNLVHGDRTIVHRMELSSMVFSDCLDPFVECCILDALAVEIHSKNCGFSAQDEITLIHCCDNLAGAFDLSLNDCAVAVLEKLRKRKDENKIHGDGDHR